jgi:hypothetical protein
MDAIVWPMEGQRYWKIKATGEVLEEVATHDVHLVFKKIELKGKAMWYDPSDLIQYSSLKELASKTLKCSNAS